LTDGAITDMLDTKDAIVSLSALPVSIIIVGVGTADFSKMEALDGDDGILRNRRAQPASRDIVQFVEFEKCMKTGTLSQQVLKEVPKQLVSYMLMAGVKPLATQVD